MIALDAFAGPGGWDEGARILGLSTSLLGIELDEHACTAAVTAGHFRSRCDIRDIDPATLNDGITGLVVSSPCPTFSDSGRGSDYQAVLDVITCAGSGCDCTWDDRYDDLAACSDPRTSLAAETMRFALGLPQLEWLAFEQVPAAETMFEDVAAELMSFDDGSGEGGHGPGWEAADVLRIDAQHLGLPVRRPRVFLVASRYTPLGGRGVDNPSMVREPTRSMAAALGWPAGHRVRTRGQRKATGGNLFPADGPSWCLTEKARSWARDADGLRLTPGEAGLLQGFRPDYPWTGSRTRQFQQAADVVCPPVAAAVLGYATGTPWREPVRAHLAALYSDRSEAAS